MTPQEVKLWNWLRETIVPAGFHVRRQVPVDRYIVDFGCLAARLAIEVDGEQHGSEEGRVRDAARDGRLAELGFRVLRFSNREIDCEKSLVLDTIYAALIARAAPRQRLARQPLRPDPPPTGGGGSGEAADGGGPAP